MVTLFLDERMIEHAPPTRHPESPERLRAVLRHLARTGISEANPKGTIRKATDEELMRVHDREHVEGVRRFSEKGGGQIEADTWMSAGSLESALLAAGAAIEATNAAIKGKAGRAFAAVRPPGHHALPFGPMGFCLFGNIAVAAAHALKALDLDRVMIVDWDVHHGNGTQEIFYGESRVAFLSAHRHPFYPGSGLADETGTGDAIGTKKNLPMRYGISRKDYISAFRASVEDLADKTRPQLLLISAGFDAHEEDPVGDLGLLTEDFIDLTKIVADVAKTHAEGRVVSILEGGYNVPILAGCVAAHLEALGAELKPGGIRDEPRS